jgi:hypothetical protein
MPLILSGDAGITFPVTAGSASAVQASSGRVLQVVYASTGTLTSATTSTYVDTALTASITPSSATSKILITAYCGQAVRSANDCQLNLQILRGATGIFLASAMNPGTTTALSTNPTLVYLDSPATTSSTTYKLQIANRDNAGTVSFNSNGTATITLMEIAA